MDVYEFEKTLLTRLQESRDVLCWHDEPVPASRVRHAWSIFIEVHIEPAGWQTLWKIPRVICEELGIKYPTIVFGVVENVIFKDLKAVLTILAVEDGDVQLPEQQEVNLEDLWPTKGQENSALNVERTADCIDQLRFFYNNVWMPWDYDNDDDLDWAEKHLERRIRFHYDLKKKEMKRSVAAHIKSLLSEARYIQNRREYLEIDLSDDDELDETLDKTQITDLMRMHMRLTIIKSEIELLENPEMRKVYEEIKFNVADGERSICNCTGSNNCNVYIVTKPHSLQGQIQFLELAKNYISEEKTVQMCLSLQEALNMCSPSDEILLTPGRHNLKFLEHFNNNGKILGLCKDITSPSEEVVIISQDDDSTLLVFDGDCELQNIILDCKNIRTGILVKNGTVQLKNCRLLGDGKSSTRQAIVASGNSWIILDNCEISNFASGIVLNDKAHLELNSSILRNCRIGVEIKDKTFAKFHESSITSSKNGVWLETEMLCNKIEQKKVVYDDLSPLKEHYCGNIPWSGNPTFETNENANVVVLNMKLSQFPSLSDELGDSSDNLLDESSFYEKCEDSNCESMVDSSVIVINDSIDEDLS